MGKTSVQDGLKFEADGEGVVFNQYSFCELVTHIMVKYADHSYDDAKKKLNKSFLTEVPTSSDDIEFLSHELPFHWAMLTAFGEMYWTKGIPSDYNQFKTEYLTWEAEIKQKHHLKRAFVYFDIL